MKSPAHTLEKLALLDPLEWSFFLLSVQSSASVRSFATELDSVRPCAVRVDLRQSKVAVDSFKAGLEDAVCKEDLNV